MKIKFNLTHVDAEGERNHVGHFNDCAHFTHGIRAWWTGDLVIQSDRGARGRTMIWLLWLIIAGLLVYLCYALIYPEKF